MSILAVDAGNSRIKWGLWEGRWSRQDSVTTGEVPLLADAWAALATPRHMIACSVAGAQVSEWLDAWARSQGITLRWVTSQREQCGVRNRYREPAQLGADRWAALIAVRNLVEGAALVVNAGTAVTIDALTQEGEFLGGLIVPGLDLMADALTRGTAGLPRRRRCGGAVSRQHCGCHRKRRHAVRVRCGGTYGTGACGARCGAADPVERGGGPGDS